MSEDLTDGALGPEPGPSRILTNSSWLVGSRLVVAAIQWFTTLLIIRTLSVDEFGQFSLIFGILGMLSIITDMGLGRIAVAMLMDAEVDQSRAAGAYITLRSVLGVLGYLIAVAFLAVGGYGWETLAAGAVGAVSVIFATVSSAHSVIFQIHQKMLTPSVSSAMAASTQMLAVLVLIRFDASLILFMTPAVLAMTVECGIRVVGARQLTPIRYTVDLRLWWHLLKEAVPISLGNAMTTLYYRVDVVMLSQLSTLVAVATYSVAYKFVDIVNMIPWAASTAALPVLVKHWPDDRVGFERVGLQIVRLLAAIGGLIGVGFLVLAEQVVPVLYGQEYADAAAPARVVVLSQCVSFAAAAALLLLIAAGNHRRFPWIAAGGLAFNVAVNLVVIPWYSYMGAAWATLATDIFMSIALWQEVRRTRIFALRPLTTLWRLLACVAATGLLGWFIAPFVWWPLAILIMTVAYLVLCVVTGALGSRTVREIVRIG